MSEKYLQYWSNQCIGGSGHGGKGGNPAIQDIQVNGYSGLEYGKKDTHVLLGGSSGTEYSAQISVGVVIQVHCKTEISKPVL